MSSDVRILTVVENTATGRGLQGEHGLAFWIEVGGRRFLFDTGQSGEVLIHNARTLGLDLNTVEAVVFSHGHYDHTGGLPALLLTIARRPQLYFHPAALQTRFSRGRDGRVQPVGIPDASRDAILVGRSTRIDTDRPTTICPGCIVTGAIPRRNDYEDTGGDFYLDAECRVPDPIVDDQAVCFQGRRGVVVLLGCAHAGVINTLTHVQQITGGAPIHALIGGMHLLHASPRRMEQTLDALRQFDVQMLAPCHCTGFAACARLWNRFTERWRPCQVGAAFDFDLDAL